MKNKVEGFVELLLLGSLVVGALGSGRAYAREGNGESGLASVIPVPTEMVPAVLGMRELVDHNSDVNGHVGSGGMSGMSPESLDSSLGGPSNHVSIVSTHPVPTEMAQVGMVDFVDGVDHRYEAEIGVAGHEVVERLLNSSYVYYGDKIDFSKTDMKPLAINVEGRDCNLVVMYNDQHDKVVYLEYPDRRGQSSWIRLLKGTGETLDSEDGNRVKLTTWMWDIDTKPWTTNTLILSYPAKGDDWLDGDAEIVFFGGPIPEASLLPIHGAVVSTKDVDENIRNILIR